MESPNTTSAVALEAWNVTFSNATMNNTNQTSGNFSTPAPTPEPTLAPSWAPTIPPPVEVNEFFVQIGSGEVPTLQPSISQQPTGPPTAAGKKTSPELTSLGFTLGISTAILSGILFSFAVAMKMRKTHIAPRCEARPREVIYNPDPACDPSQDKGNPFFLGWVWWVLNLSYKDLLGGVPGTGTRNGGLKGKFLRVNLDHVILLRFNALGLKISLISSVVYLTICLPIYFYSRCPWVPLGEINVGIDSEEVFTNCTNEQNYTFSSYVRFTLANVPDLDSDFFSASYQVESFLFYMISIASWIVVWFACFELFHEWIDEVALRRVYYLEYNHWQGAKDELKKTMLDAIQPQASRFGAESMMAEEHLFKRDVWIPHPEQRDTPSNVELYSVLVGGIPSRPHEAMNAEDVEEAVKKDSSQVDWQMELVSTFFDSCVPNMPGYTSSVAAVTILPSATELAMAWSCWYKAAKKLSRLRFIRSRIIELGGTPVGQKLAFDQDERKSRRKQRKEVGDAARRREYSAEVLGAGMEDDANDEFWKSLDLGPEQIAVYSKEFSRGLAGCCPHGFCEQRISYCKDLDFLLELEADAADAVSAAYAELKAAGALAATSHEKRKHLMKLVKLGKLADITGNIFEPLFESSVEFPDHFKSTTEMQLMNKRRKMSEDGVMTASGKSLSEHVDESERDNNFGSESPTRIAAAQLDSMVGARKEKELWDVVETIAFEVKNNKRKTATAYKVQNGKWSFPTPQRVMSGIKRKIASLLMWTSDNSNEATDLLARDTTYAVVTFTSRQAAIAARQCLADGRGADAFTTTPVLPVPPLADSAAFNACDFRGCMKPVTIGLNEYQKSWRKSTVTFTVAFIYVFYTYPISQVSTVTSNLVWLLIPKLPIDFTMTKAAVEGWLEAQILNLFLAFLPDLFLFLSNFGSNATSMVEAENMALRFYWYFMVCFAMVGSSIFQMGQEIWESGSLDITDILHTIARTIPVDVSFTWTNWIITRATTFTPAFYLLQLNTFIFAAFGLQCCVRMFRGGGAGNRLPYRIYVENATVLLCALALAPGAPLISPFAVLYFLICTPLLRYVVIFTYKPPFDSGGSRWPALFDTIIVSLVVSQVLLSTMLFLKKAVGASIFAFVPVGPIILFRRRMRSRFLAAFNDAALLQTSMLDGWDLGSESEQLSFREREEFRRFLVDAHKAAYVPICIAATSVQNNITAEPAEVIWKTEEEKRQMENWANEGDAKDRRDFFRNMQAKRSQQFGALNRRNFSSLRDLSTAGGEALGARLTPRNNVRSSTPSHGMPPTAVIVETEQSSEEESAGKDKDLGSDRNDDNHVENAEVSELGDEDVELGERGGTSVASSLDGSSPPVVLDEASESPSIRVTRLGHFFPSPTGEMAYEFTFRPGSKKDD